jgi:hypothetical protein
MKDDIDMSRMSLTRKHFNLNLMCMTSQLGHKWKVNHKLSSETLLAVMTFVHQLLQVCMTAIPTNLIEHHSQLLLIVAVLVSQQQEH